MKKSTNTDLLPIIFFSDGGGASGLISCHNWFWIETEFEILWKILPLLKWSANYFIKRHCSIQFIAYVVKL
jgi:hypothetical protein